MAPSLAASTATMFRRVFTRNVEDPRLRRELPSDGIVRQLCKCSPRLLRLKKDSPGTAGCHGSFCPWFQRPLCSFLAFRKRCDLAPGVCLLSALFTFVASAAGR